HGTARVHRRGLPGWTGGQQRPAQGRGHRRRHRRPGGRVLPARGAGERHRPGGLAAARRQARRLAGSRDGRRRGRGGAARPQAGGDRPDPRRRPGRPAGRARDHGRHASLAEAAGALMPPPAPAPGAAGAAAEATIFTTLTGGLGTLPAAVAAASGAEVLTRAMVRELARSSGGWRLTVGSAHAPEGLAADAVVLAVPAQPAARLLSGLPGAADARAA